MLRLPSVICLGTLLLNAGCLSLRARSARLAALQIARVDAVIENDPAGGIDRALCAYTRFLHQLPPHASLDPVRAKILRKRGEVYARAGKPTLATADFQRAKALEPLGPGGVPRLPPEATPLPGTGGPPPAGTASPTAPEATVPRADNFLLGWGALPLAIRVHRDAKGLAGTKIDVLSDIEAPNSLVFARFVGEARVTARASIGFEGQAAAFEGSGPAGSEVRYDGATFPAGPVLEGSFRVWDGGLFLRASPSLRRGLRVGVDMGFRYIRFHSRFRSGSLVKEDALDAFFPLLGLLLVKEFSGGRIRLTCDVRACGLYWAQGETTLESRFLELGAGLDFALLPRLSLALGVRGHYSNYTFEREGQEKGLTLAYLGPVVGVNLRL